MDEQNNLNDATLQDAIDSDKDVNNEGFCNEQTENDGDKAQQAPHIDKKVRVFDIFYLALCSVFMLVMWCSGFNFLPLIANVLAIVAGVLIFARVLIKKNVGLYMWIAYMVCI